MLKNRLDLSALLPLLILVAIANMLAAPRFEVALVSCAMALSVLFAPRFEVLDTSKGRWQRVLTVYVPIVLLGAFVTAPTWMNPQPFVGIDGTVNEAIIGEIVDQAAQGRPLRWATRISTGEPTLDLYPTLVHRGIAFAARLTRTEDQLTRWLGALLSLAYIAAALGMARTSYRISRNGFASLAIGTMALLDTGTDFTWGTRPIFVYGFLPSTVTIALTMHVLPSLLDLARRPRTSTFLLSALGVGASVGLHPLGLVIHFLLLGTLFVTWLGGAPRTQRQAALPLAAMVLGLLLTAFVWMPAASRLLAYGVHYGTPEVRLSHALESMRSGVLPDGAFSPLIVLTWFGALALLLPRTRIEGRWVAAIAFLLIFAYVDIAFLDLGIAPSATSVRWQSFRIGTFVKPLIYIVGGGVLGAAGRLVQRWNDVPPIRRGLRIAALLAVLMIAYGERDVIRAGLEAQDAQRRSDMIDPAATDPQAMVDLYDHLFTQLANTPEGQAPGRLIQICERACELDVFRFVRNLDGTSTGLEMALRQPAPPAFMLHEQFFTMSEENLHRFGVRWILSAGDPPQGDITTERHFGRLTLREVPAWTGELGHVERGEGQVHVRTVQGEGFDVTLSGTTAPALVSVGTPYYPRLVATHESGASVPVYALPVAPESEGVMVEHSAAMWLSPGTTRLRADGALPSDGRGTFFSVAALLGLVVLSQRRFRAYVLSFKLASLRTRRFALLVLVAVGCVALPLRSFFAPADALRFGTFFPRPTISVAVDGEDIACEPDWLGRVYHCPDDVEVSMVVAHTLQDWHVGWPVPAPAVEIRGGRNGSVYTVELPSTTLHGAYLANCSGCRSDIEVLSHDGAAWSGIFHTPMRRELEGRGLRVRIAPHGGEARASLLSTRFLDPEPMPPVPEHP